MKLALRAVALATGALLLAGCGAGSTANTGSGTVTVFAAASLTESFNILKVAFEKANPGSTVTLSYGASSTLAQQIVQGAPADVFASASTATMKTLTDAGRTAGEPATFAQNTLAIVTPPSQTEVTSLADFANPALNIVLCATPVPCGAASDKAFAKAGIVPSVDSREADVKSVLAKVQSGDADAGLVYVTDAKAAGTKVREVAIPADQNQSTAYQIVAVKDTSNPSLAAAWVAFIRGPEGQQVLAAQGFASP